MSITVSTDRSKLDVDLIHHYLSEESYWAKAIPRDVVQRSIDNALCFGAYDGDALVGFARVITDYAVFAYIGDVFVIESHRGRGISKMIMTAIMEHASLQGLRRWSLVTSDAQGLYRQFGFKELAAPEKHLERVLRNPYSDPPVTPPS
jgi:GNAT superfamily N-acetyltransferase